MYSTSSTSRPSAFGAMAATGTAASSTLAASKAEPARKIASGIDPAMQPGQRGVPGASDGKPDGNASRDVVWDKPALAQCIADIDDVIARVNSDITTMRKEMWTQQIALALGRTYNPDPSRILKLSIPSLIDTARNIIDMEQRKVHYEQGQGQPGPGRSLKRHRRKVQWQRMAGSGTATWPDERSVATHG